MYSKLPLLPKDLEIVILHPRVPESVEQSHDDSTTASKSVEQPSRYDSSTSQITTPGYADFTWNYDNLSQLPEDSNVFDELNIHGVEEFGGLLADAGPVEGEGDDIEAIDEAAVPNLLIHDPELDQLRGRVNEGAGEAGEQVALQPAVPQAAHQLRMPSVRRTPLDEFYQKYALLSLACPTLFPRGVADFVEPRQCTISYQGDIQHAMK